VADLNAELSRLHLVVRGEVQGVGFRYFVVRRATGLGLAGWVRNRPDGSVELVAEGAASHLDALRREVTEGPPRASVTEVEEWAVAPNETFPRPFDVR